MCVPCIGLALLATIGCFQELEEDDLTERLLFGLTIVEDSGSLGPADFLFVVDNSASMSQEQASVQSAAGSFFTSLTTARFEFQVAVITTDSSTLRGSGFTNDRTEFESAVNGVGTAGNGNESGILYANEALDTGGSVITAGYPRRATTMHIIMVSDAGDSWNEDLGGAFDPADNLFIDNGYTVHAIMSLDSSGSPAACTGSAGKSSEADGSYTLYYDLVQNTGGHAGSICDDDYSATLDTVVDTAAAEAGG